MTNSFHKTLLKQAQLLEKSMNSIERDLGYPRNSLNNYKYGRKPSAKRVLELSAYFGVQPEYLLGIDKESLKIEPLNLFKQFDLEHKKEMCKICLEWLSSGNM